MNKRTRFSGILIKRSSLFFNYSFLSTAIESFQQPHNLITCIASLQASAHHKNLAKGKEIHSYMLLNGFLNFPLSVTSLINMYSKCNQMSHALSIFNEPTREINVFCFNGIISGFITNGFPEEGFEFYQKMRNEGVVPDKFTFPCAIKACLDVFEIKKIHGLLFKFGLELDVFIGSALVNCYLKFGLMEHAQVAFEEFPTRDVVLWNAMVNGYA